MRTAIAGLALALALTPSAGAGPTANLSELLTDGDRALNRHSPAWAHHWSYATEIYRSIQRRDIAYKRRREHSPYIGTIDPPFVTPDADRVEVLAFQTYGHPGWTSNHNVEIMWSRTLPEAVDVVYLPEKALRQITKRPRIQALHATRQNLYQTAVAMGVPPWDAHHLIVQAMIHSNKALESERTHRNYAKLLDLDPDAFQAQRSSAAVRWAGDVADWLEWAQSGEMHRLVREVARGGRTSVQTYFPELLIDGRYVVSMSARRKPIKTYWMANWAIRQALRDLKKNRHWPRNAVELAEWLTPRSGQILSRRMNGKWMRKHFPPGIVYDANDRAIWMLDATGAVENVAKLTESAEGAHSVYRDYDGSERWFDPWRVARQLTAWVPAGADVATRHGAFMLAEHLAGRAEPLALTANGAPMALTFESDGQAQIQAGRKTLPATWRVGAEDLTVTTAAGEAFTWRWQSVARRAGLSIAEEARRPWDFPHRYQTPKQKRARSALEQDHDSQESRR